MAPPRNRRPAAQPLDLDALDAALDSTIPTPPTVVEGSTFTALAVTKTKSALAKKSAFEAAALVPATTVEPDEPPAIIDPRTLPVRYSRLKAMELSPLHYFNACQRDVKQTLALRMGSGTHAMMFGLPVLPWHKRRAGREWDEFRDAAGDTPILNRREFARAKKMVEALRKHPLAAQILFAADSVYEELIEWSRDGRACQSRVDVYNARLRAVIEYKTAREVGVQWFHRECWKRGYPGQVRWYDHALDHKYGWRPQMHLIVAQESIDPFDVTVHNVGPAALMTADRIIEAWWERLMLAEATDVWLGQSSQVNIIEPPDFGPWSFDGTLAQPDDDADDVIDVEETEAA